MPQTSRSRRSARVLSSWLLLAAFGAHAGDDCETITGPEVGPNPTGDLRCEGDVYLEGVADNGLTYEPMPQRALETSHVMALQACNLAKSQADKQSLVFAELQYTRNGLDAGTLVLSSEFVDGSFYLVFDWITGRVGWTTPNASTWPASPVHVMPLADCGSQPLSDDPVKIQLKRSNLEVTRRDQTLFSVTIPGITMAAGAQAYPVEYRLDDFLNDGFAPGTALRTRWTPEY